MKGSERGQKVADTCEASHSVTRVVTTPRTQHTQPSMQHFQPNPKPGGPRSPDLPKEPHHIRAADDSLAAPRDVVIKDILMKRCFYLVIFEYSGPLAAASSTYDRTATVVVGCRAPGEPHGLSEKTQPPSFTHLFLPLKVRPGASMPVLKYPPTSLTRPLSVFKPET